jgi:hypothetical protein
MNTNNIPALDNTRIHSPAEIAAWKQKHADAYNARIAAENAAAAIERAKQTPKILSKQEQYERALANEAVKQERLLEEAVLAAAEEQAKIDYLASSPDVVEVSERNPHALLLNLEHWVKRGYSIDLDNLDYFQHGMYIVNLKKPVTKKAAK